MIRIGLRQFRTPLSKTIYNQITLVLSRSHIGLTKSPKNTEHSRISNHSRVLLAEKCKVILERLRSQSSHSEVLEFANLNIAIFWDLGYIMKSRRVPDHRKSIQT